MHLRNITVNCTKYNIILIYLDVGVKYEPDLFLTGESNSPGLSSSALVLLCYPCVPSGNWTLLTRGPSLRVHAPLSSAVSCDPAAAGSFF